MTPSERTMPTISAVWSPMDRKWIVYLPHGLELMARDEAEAAHIVSGHAPGSALRFLPRHVAPPTESEKRAAWGDR